jgi:hypothetical protein
VSSQDTVTELRTLLQQQNTLQQQVAQHNANAEATRRNAIEAIKKYDEAYGTDLLKHAGENQQNLTQVLKVLQQHMAKHNAQVQESAQKVQRYLALYQAGDYAALNREFGTGEEVSEEQPQVPPAAVSAAPASAPRNVQEPQNTQVPQVGVPAHAEVPVTPSAVPQPQVPPVQNSTIEEPATFTTPSGSSHSVESLFSMPQVPASEPTSTPQPSSAPSTEFSDNSEGSFDLWSQLNQGTPEDGKIG